MHRTVGTVAIKDDILYIADFSGLFHCLDAKTGKVHWTYDMLAAAWGSPLIVDDKVYIGDEDGDVAIFRHSADPEVAMEDGDAVLWRNQHGQQRLQHADRRRQRAVHRQPHASVRHYSRREVMYREGKRMPKRVLDVGNCEPDFGSISRFSDQELRLHGRPGPRAARTRSRSFAVVTTRSC